MRVVVFGGRDYDKLGLIFKALDQIHAQYGITVLIDGTAKGVDTIAHKWALAHNIATERYKPDWAKYGRAAGPIRNREMAEEGKPDMGVAFPGGNGTYHMKKTLKEMGIKVLNVVPIPKGE